MVKTSCLLSVAAASALVLAVGCSLGVQEEEDDGSSGVESSPLVISQVYTGGGMAGAPLDHSFVEIFNSGAAAVSLEGLAVQYAQDNASFDEHQIVKLPKMD